MVRTSRERVETSESLRLEEVVDGIDATSDMCQLVAPAATTDDLRITSHVAGEASTHICAQKKWSTMSLGPPVCAALRLLSPRRIASMQPRTSSERTHPYAIGDVQRGNHTNLD
jgi:hypothetical protein